MRHLRLGVALVALAVPAIVAAQETTSAIRGDILNEQSAAIAGATVTIIHVPSGTRVVQTSGANGEFNATGLRLGGPYSITVEAPGYDAVTETVDGLIAGTPQRLSVFLASAGKTIVVTGTRQRSAITIASGPATVLTARDIAGIATVSRDIRNLAARSPFVSLDPTNGRGAISILGQNNRFNRITVDGIQFGDPFGLEAGGLASARGPVPLDAISEFTVEVAPVDIQQGFFQGGAINTQLKSGTNRFHATGFYTAIPGGFTGTRARGTTFQTGQSRNFGVSVDGPIIKDKLFFAVTWERLRDQIPAIVGANEVGVSAAEIQRVQDIARTVYGYDAGGVADQIGERDDKVVAKLDWNIADGHRAAFTYIYNEGNILAGQTGANERPGQTANPTLSLLSNNYNQGTINHYGVFQLNDQWSDNFSTQLRISYNDYKRIQEPFNGRSFGQFQVCLAEGPTVAAGNPACPNGEQRIQFGPDISRQANELFAKTLGIEFQAQLKMNSHTVKFIAERRSQDFNNLFAQNVSGNFRFDSIQDLINRTPNQLTLAVPLQGNIDTVRARFNSTVNTIGLQDTWDVTDNLTVTAGFRWDLFETDDQPVFNPNFLARTGLPNNATLNGRTLFQPRASFVWRADDRLTVRASGGLFGGGNPNVWISNNYSNPGVLLAQANFIRDFSSGGAVQLRTTDLALTSAQQATVVQQALTGVTGGTGVPDSVRQALITGGSTLSVTNALDPDFRIPSQWRIASSIDYVANLGFLGDEWRFGADVIWSRVKDGIQYTDLRSVRNVVNATLPDGRPRYQQLAGLVGGFSVNPDLLLTNDSRGYSWNIVARVDKRWSSGVFFNAAYTFQRAKDTNSGTSSVAASNYGQTAAADPNFSAYGTSIYQVDDAYRINVGIDRKIFGDNNTRIELFFNSRAGQRFSYTFADTTPNRSAVFGTVGTNNRYLMYVPVVGGDPRVSYLTSSILNSAGTAVSVTGIDQQGFLNFIQNSELNAYQGQIAPKNIGRSPRFNKLDLSVRQEIPFVFGGKMEVFADIENVLNLINSDWGTLRQPGFPYMVNIANVRCAGFPTTGASPSTPCTQYQLVGARAGTVANPVPAFQAPQLTTFNASLWGIRIGARVKF